MQDVAVSINGSTRSTSLFVDKNFLFPVFHHCSAERDQLSIIASCRLSLGIHRSALHTGLEELQVKTLTICNHYACKLSLWRAKPDPLPARCVPLVVKKMVERPNRRDRIHGEWTLCANRSVVASGICFDMDSVGFSSSFFGKSKKAILRKLGLFTTVRRRALSLGVGLTET